MIELFFSFFLILRLFLLPNSGESKVVQVQVTTRHCDRTPVSPWLIPSCPVDLGKELGLDPGTLTALGEHQCYELGRFMHQTYMIPDSDLYIDGIPQLWNPYDFKFTTTQKHRALRSAWSITKALFPVGHKVEVYPFEGNFSLPGQSQSVPIETTYEINNDHVLGELGICVSRYNLYLKWLGTPEGEQKIRDLNNKYMIELNRAAGTNFTFPQYGQLYDPVVVLHDHRLLCEGLENDYYLVEEAIAELMKIMLSDKFSNNVPVGQGLVNAIMTSVDSLISKKAHPPKFVHFSGHDTTIWGLVMGLQLLNDYPELYDHPGWGSAFYFELHQNNVTNEYYVQVKYQNMWNVKPKILTMKTFGCEDPMCELDTFKDLVKKKLTISTDDWCRLCQNDFSEFCLVKPEHLDRIPDIFKL